MIVDLGEIWLDRSNRRPCRNRIEIEDRQPSQLFGLDVAGDHKIESEQLHDYEAASAALDLGAVSHDPSVASSLRD